MTTAQQPCGNAVARHFAPESFVTYARGELDACAPWQRGVCFNPACGRKFEANRDWQIYCCTACERAGVADLRKWGHRMALPLLTWRVFKYDSDNADAAATRRAARRFITHAQSAWLAERAARAPDQGAHHD